MAQDWMHEWIADWSGDNRLWLAPLPAEPQISSCHVQGRARAHGGFLELSYTWNYQGSPQDGMLVLGNQNAHARFTGMWFDAWHMRSELMFLSGQLLPDGVVCLTGHYAAPPGPDWGWEIRLKPPVGGIAMIEMTNISPAADRSLAVQIRLHRVPPLHEPRS